MLRTLRAWGAVLGYMAVLFWISGQAVPAPGLDLGAGTDKVAHALLYLILSFLLIRALHVSARGRPAWIWPVVGVLVSILFGIGDEVHQALVPVRDGSAGDVVADAVGSLLGAVAWAVHRRLSSATADPDVAR